MEIIPLINLIKREYQIYYLFLSIALLILLSLIPKFLALWIILVIFINYFKIKNKKLKKLTVNRYFLLKIQV